MFEDDVLTPVSPADLPARVHALMSRARPEVDGELAREAVLAGWRVARALASQLGYLAEDERLEDAVASLTDLGDPWRQPLRPRAAARASFRSAGLGALRAGTSLLPTTGPPAEVAAWCELAAAVLDDLGAWGRDAARPALRALIDPEIVGELPLSPGNLLALEDELIEQAIVAIVELGDQKARTALREELGLHRKEALSLLALARHTAAERAAGSTIEAERAMAVLRLRHYLDRSRATMNMADELRAEKLLAVVQGLTRSEPEDQLSVFRNVVSDVADRQDADVARPSAPAQASPASDAPPRTEAEAAVRFDEENATW